MRMVTRMTIEDAKHIPEERRKEIIDSYPDHEREARIKGIPSLGSGRVYPYPESGIRVDPFEVPPFWRQIGGIDFGWDHPTAMIKLSWDVDNDIIYVTNAYRRREAVPLEHAIATKNFRRLVPFAWPKDGYQRDKKSGEELRHSYSEAGVIMLAEHATHVDGGDSVEAGLMRIATRMKTGRFKVFSTLDAWWEEFRLYHRKDGAVVKERDDLMDATRYAEMMLRFSVAPYMVDPAFEADRNQDMEDGAGANPTTGY